MQKINILPRIPANRNEKELLSNFGFILREIRIGIGYQSIDSFTKANGLSFSVYSRWESGENMNVLSIMRLCTIYKASPSDLMDLWYTYNDQKQKLLYKKKMKTLVERAQPMLLPINTCAI